MPFQSIFQETGTQMLKGKADINDQMHHPKPHLEIHFEKFSFYFTFETTIYLP